jgi:hypothetical protein
MPHRLALAAVAAVALVVALLPAAALAKGRDRNHDRIPDRWERTFHLSLRVNQAHRDQDRDGLDNLAEYRDHTNPRKADSDGDGLDDGTEVEVGDNPSKPDSDEDGVKDGAEDAGTVDSFDGKTLVIALADGTKASGLVDASTEIECDGDATARESDHGGDDPGSDDGRSACGTADLEPGAPVREAELATVDGQAVWHEVKLHPAS